MPCFAPYRSIACYCLVLLWSLELWAGLGAVPRASGEEDEAQYFRQWLEQEVGYLISDEEKEVFLGLRTAAEKERFIEQFWYRRDPDPRTPINEFRQEHYRRVAYANERFQSGIAGWKTDRGRIYILHGPPDELESHPSGGRYFRGPLEGGGSSTSFPFERWRYRYIEGLGPDIELEFVDSTWAGEYRLARGKGEKDALMRVPNAGLNRAERMGLARKRDRSFFQPGMRGFSPLVGELAKDSPFALYERETRLMSPAPASDSGLRERVQVDLSYERFGYRIRSDHFALAGGKALVAITLELENRDFTFIREAARHAARLVIYGSITDIGDHLVEEFEEEVMLTYPEEERAATLSSRSLYQRILTLQQGGHYRLDLVIKDGNSGRMGSVRTGVHVGEYPGQGVAASSLVLSDLIVPLPRMPGRGSMFVLGDIKVRPSVDNRFVAGNQLGLYLQLYNLGIDPTDQRPWLETQYRIRCRGEAVLETRGGPDEGLRIYPDGRVALIKSLAVSSLQPGRYQFEVELLDRIKGESLQLRQDFELIADPGKVNYAQN